MFKKLPFLPSSPWKIDAVGNGVLLVIASAFSAVYAAGLAGLIRPLPDATALIRLEPIIFLVLGYLFSRFPAQQNERVLRDEIDRTSKKVEIAQRLKEQADGEREAIEEKLRNARVALRTGLLGTNSASPSRSQEAEPSEQRSSPTQVAVETAINILNS